MIDASMNLECAVTADDSDVVSTFECRIILVHPVRWGSG
jgi:hypothetical protein